MNTIKIDELDKLEWLIRREDIEEMHSMDRIYVINDFWSVNSIKGYLIVYKMMNNSYYWILKEFLNLGSHLSIEDILIDSSKELQEEILFNLDVFGQ